jgi:hypothetical protein
VITQDALDRRRVMPVLFVAAVDHESMCADFQQFAYCQFETRLSANRPTLAASTDSPVRSAALVGRAGGRSSVACALT